MLERHEFGDLNAPDVLVWSAYRLRCGTRGSRGC